MRVPCVAGNWKMHKTVAESVSLVKELLPGLDRIDGVESIICPPFTALANVADQIGAPLSPEEMKDKISEALYFAAFEEFSLDVLSNPELNLDPPLRHLLEARKALLTGRIDVAEQLVEQVMQERPDLLEAYLIKSDILFAQERFDAARDLLLDLEQMDDLPVWIQEELRLQPE